MNTKFPTNVRSAGEEADGAHDLVVTPPWANAVDREIAICGLEFANDLQELTKLIAGRIVEGQVPSQCEVVTPVGLDILCAQTVGDLDRIVSTPGVDDDEFVEQRPGQSDAIGQVRRLVDSTNIKRF